MPTLTQIREGAAGDHNLLVKAVADTVNGTVVTVNALGYKIPSPDRARDAYMTKDGDTFRLITTPTTSLQEVTLDSALPTLVNGDDIRIYFLLSPEELNDALNEELQLNSYETRYDITLVSGTNEYTLPAHVTSRTHVLGVIFRYSVSGSPIVEQPAPSFMLIEDDNVVTLQIINMPVDLTNLTCVVRLRKYYDSLATEASITTMPYNYAVKMASMAMMKKLATKYGADAVRKIFKDEMNQSRLEYLRMKQEHEPVAEATDLYQDFAWEGPDIPLDYLQPSW